MDSAAVIQKIEQGSGELFHQLSADLQSNLGTSHYRRLSEEELLLRHSAIIQGLCQWLSSHDDLALQKSAADLGQRRFREGIPLGQVVLALILVERHVVQFLNTSLQEAANSSGRAVTEFFQKYAYFTAKGYEVALAVSNRMAGEPADALAEGAPKKAAARTTREGDMEISRGGQVGEYGG